MCMKGASSYARRISLPVAASAKSFATSRPCPTSTDPYGVYEFPFEYFDGGVSKRWDGKMHRSELPHRLGPSKMAGHCCRTCKGDVPHTEQTPAAGAALSFFLGGSPT